MRAKLVRFALIDLREDQLPHKMSSGSHTVTEFPVWSITEYQSGDSITDLQG